MTQLATDVAGIGNAIVDVIARADEAFLAAHGLAKGTMTLIHGARAEALYAAMGSAREISGGSAANTLAGVAALGGEGAFIGKVRNDQLGGIFRHDIQALGVTFDTPPATSGEPTARCLIFVTPDAQRTMNTYLGAAVSLGPEDVDPATVQGAKVLYLEGYLFDPPAAQAAFVAAARLAHRAGRKVALTLSDPFCVARHKQAFRKLVEGHVDLLFANLAEAESLTDSQGLDDAAAALAGKAEVVVITQSEKGALVLADGQRHAVAAVPPKQLVDSTGAGDLFAAGFLVGYTRGKALADCGRLGALAATECIGHYGARPERDLKALAAERLGPHFLA
jgi:sugar/nucleoside kinase (ribokinase family)